MNKIGKWKKKINFHVKIIKQQKKQKKKREKGKKSEREEENPKCEKKKRTKKNEKCSIVNNIKYIISNVMDKDMW